MNSWISPELNDIVLALPLVICATLLIILAFLAGWERFTAVRDRLRYGKPGRRLDY